MLSKASKRLYSSTIDLGYFVGHKDHAPHRVDWICYRLIGYKFAELFLILKSYPLLYGFVHVDSQVTGLETFIRMIKEDIASIFGLNLTDCPDKQISISMIKFPSLLIDH